MEVRDGGCNETNQIGAGFRQIGGIQIEHVAAIIVRGFNILESTGW
jgi:hypothetical protein